MSLKFLNGGISAEDYKKILHELLKKVAEKYQMERILTINEDVAKDSLERWLEYNNVCKFHYSILDGDILEEREIFVIHMEESCNNQLKETSYTGSYPNKRIPYNDFIDKLQTEEILKMLAKNLANLGF